ncbi:four-carbon acid sugar kinase family protein [Aureimonas leprariae]|uniref:Hrp-dependent type III effector protein n=1 Tax=Plantimonas leprariae TaxID=2615207 RepID=A0A7V7PKC4_9HYPH|nr:four-carbon acid sugar kinase family protein [Aureimonas leprariae]KAB0676087.1 Hrp-dependent type III effector protein [Aureimonas leprariae]
MTALRLIADDLTGALDSAAAFASPDAPVPVRWCHVPAAQGSLAYDSGTRETEPAEATARLRDLAPLLGSAGTAIRYKKIDSLLRGREAEEIGAILDVLRPEFCVLAPAFPAQNRATRAGRQMVRAPSGEWRPTDADLGARLEATGHLVHRAAPGEAPCPGITLFDAETDADLDRIASTPVPADVVWVGSGGLAAAIARRHAGTARPSPQPLPSTILGLFGTDHEVMRGQLKRVVDWHEIVHDVEAEAGCIERLLRERGAVFLTVSVPPGTGRGPAADHIGAAFAALAGRLAPPGTLLVAGGETLRRLCDALGAGGLNVTGEVVPGVPRSVLKGGRWDGTAVVSKSGAFGSVDFLRDLVAPASQGIQA